ncbi:MAG: hypothetical protein M0Q02_13890, partial [Candidatus Muirbacterium halophilum]|nr:hypothetical protein [Candidatus Muirbacterium halophilum]
MKNKTIILFVFFSFILSLSINAEEKRILSEEEKKYYIDRMIDIVAYYYHDNPEFLGNLKVHIRLGKSYEVEKGKNLIKCSLSDYDKEKKEYNANFEFRFADRKLIFFSENNCYEKLKKKNGEKIEKIINEEKIIKSGRNFLSRFVPELDNDYFLKIWVDKLHDFGTSELGGGFYFYIYYKGYKTTDVLLLDFYLDGKIRYYSLSKDYNYKIPEKILTWEEALKKLNNEINSNPKKYYNIESFADIKVLTD